MDVLDHPLSNPAFGFLAELERCAQTYARTMSAPDAQWPVLLCVIPQNATPVLLGIPDANLRSHPLRDSLARKAARLAREHRAKLVVLLYPRFSATAAGEHLCIAAFSKGQGLCLLSRVERFWDKPPRLASWRPDHGLQDPVSIRFHAALAPVFNHISKND